MLFLVSCFLLKRIAHIIKLDINSDFSILKKIFIKSEILKLSEKIIPKTESNGELVHQSIQIIIEDKK